MGFGQTDRARASQTHRAHCLRVRPFTACPMAIGVLELIRVLPLPCGKKRLHLLFWMQGHTAPSRSRTGGPSGTDFTIALGELPLDERFAGILWSATSSATCACCFE